MVEPPQADDGAPQSLSSPRQASLLSIMVELGRPISTSELAQIAGQTLGATAHHVRALARDGLIEWAGERRVRGALQTYYVPSDAGLEALRTPRIEALLTMFGALPAIPGAEGGPTAALDRGAVEDLRRLIDELRPRVQDIMAAAAARQAG